MHARSWRAILAVAAIGLSSGCPTPELRFDFDADGIEDAVDCAPTDPSVWPGAPDPHGDGLDTNCDGLDGIDGDGDGYPALPEDGGAADAAWDCDDARPDVHPGVDDPIGDELDANCDGHDGVDLDGDGHASQASGGADCDDALASVWPGAPDPFGDAVDSNCDSMDGTDSDQDGFPAFDPDYSGGFEAWDCYDLDPGVHPGAGDAAGDELDADCDGVDGVDGDGDGYAGAATGGDDCDDADDTIHPGAGDPYGDGQDGDCDGWDGVDRDGDGYPANPGLETEDWFDCDDSDPAVHPGAVEVVGDGADNDCDGSQLIDDDGDGRPAGPQDCDDSDATVFLSAPELTDCLDNDCDGQVDEQTLTSDDDGDGACEGADLGFGVQCCDGSVPGDCDDGSPAANPNDLDADGFATCAAIADCDDGAPLRFPGAPELCDGQDNDCDGVVPADEADSDADGAAGCAGDCDDSDPAQSPFDLDGDGASTCAGDCDDTDPAANPNDLDADGYSTCNAPPDCYDLDPLLNPFDGDGDTWSTCTGDCDDASATSWDGAVEVGDGLDNDCDGDVDEGTETADGDGDGWCQGIDLDGDGDLDCTDGSQPGDCDDFDPLLELDDLDGDGVDTCAGDCDDAEPTVWPDAPELCDGLDNDCDADIDEGMHDDLDLDGMTPCQGDCDDLDDDVFDGAAELCDGLDNDCDGGLPAVEHDLDVDGTMVCAGDCDDTDLEVGPAAAEQCDGFDQDCDGEIDEACVSCDRTVPVEYPTIQQAIDASLDGERICVQPGTWYEHLWTDGRAIHLLGLAGAGATIVHGGGLGPVLTVDWGEGPDTVIEGLTITGGVAVQGGGVLVVGADPTLVGLVVSGNQADDGGGLYLEDSATTLDGVTVADNAATVDGGGVNVFGGSPTLQDSLLVDNVAGSAGAGLYAESTDLVVVGTTFEGNSGGGGATVDTGSVSFSEVRFEENQGGGLEVAGWTAVVLERVWFEENRTDSGYGGLRIGLDNGPSPSAVLSNVVLLRNPPSGMNIQAVSVSMDHVAVISSPGDGIQLRGHYWYGGNYTFTNGLVAGSNSGLRLFAANAYLAGITLVGSSSNWAGFQADDETSATLSGLIATGFDHGIRGELGSNLTVTSCDVWGNTTGAYIGTPDPTGVDGNISVDPGFVHTSSTDPWEWDLHLSTTSPLVDAGPLLDPDGSPSDIGAFGGPGADGWDLDGDGWMQWWQPGPYDSSAYPAFGLDCDDLDPLVSPPSGC